MSQLDSTVNESTGVYEKLFLISDSVHNLPGYLRNKHEDQLKFEVMCLCSSVSSILNEGEICRRYRILNYVLRMNELAKKLEQIIE